MTIYKLSCSVTVSAWTEVEANSLEDAIAEAAMRGVELHFNGSGCEPSESWLIEDADGLPQDIRGEAE